MSSMMSDSCLHTTPVGAAGQLFTNLISSLLVSQCSLGTPSQFPRDTHDFLDSYDFIVVGAGSAGSVLANRLTEDPHRKVLLVEAGTDPPLSSEVPGLFFTLQNTDADWAFKTEPQEGLCQGLVGGRCVWSAGRVLGGSSTINAMNYVRGNKRDYDDWASAGNTGWSYEDVLPYFKKSEDDRGLKENSTYHSKGGHLTIEDFHYDHPITGKLKTAAKELGYEILSDINGPKQVGFSHVKGTLRDGRRCSTAKAFLSSISNRTNLHVTKQSLVTRILIDPDTKTATGVEFLKHNQTIQVRATKEVLLSAGTMQSPKILMLSGIGPKDHLQEIGISPVIHDLSVGQNLQDHLRFPGVMFALKRHANVPALSELESTFYFLVNKSGPLTNIGMSNLMGFVNTSDVASDTPNVQIIPLYFPFNSSDVARRAYEGDSAELTKATLTSNRGADTLQFFQFPLKPKSRGEILLRSKDPEDQPRIFANSLNDPEDLEGILESIDFVKKIGKTNVMQELEAKLVEVQYKNCEGLEFDTKSYWTCAVRQVATTMYHPVGTCKMGPAGDRTAVVDDHLKVHGVNNLRVVDASVMPTITSGNTNAATIMIAEKASDMVKSCWRS